MTTSFDRIRNDRYAPFHRCYAQCAKDQPFFAALIKVEQALIARLPPR